MAGGTGLEEPGWPNLQSGPPAGALFMNAFAKASDVNMRKQRLEQQLIQMDMNMKLSQDKNEREIQKMAMDYGFKTAGLQRQYDAMAMDSAYKDRMMALKEQDSKNKFDAGMNLVDQGAQYSDEVAALNQKYEPGTRAWGAAYQAIHTKYQGFLQTPQGQRLDNDNVQNHKFGALSRHRDAADAKNQFYANLAAIGKSKDFNLDDFVSGKWGTTGTTGGDKWIATDKTTGQRLSPEEVAKVNSKNVAFHTMDPANYKLHKMLADNVMKYASGDPGTQPDIVQQTKTDRARMALTDPEATSEEKAAAARILGVDQ
jgi:hypothetical protein